MTVSPDDRSLGELVADATQELRLLARQEIQLAKAELAEQARRLAAAGVSLAAGAALAYAGLLVLLAAWALGLVRLGAPAWSAVLIIAIVVLAVGGALIGMGVKKLKQGAPVPRRTAHSVKTSVARVKDSVRTP